MQQDQIYNRVRLKDQSSTVRYAQKSIRGIKMILTGYMMRRHYSKVSRRSMTRQEYNHICGLPTILLASVLCVLNQTPVKAETYIEPYSHVTIEITEDYASSNDSFGSIELNGKYIQLPCKASLIFDLGFTPEEVFDYPYYDEVGLFSLIGDGHESSIPVKLPMLAVVILLVGVTGGICRVLWRHKRYSIHHSRSWLIMY